MLGTFAIVAEEHSTDRCVSAACCPSPGDPEPPLYCCGQRAAAALRRALQREGGLHSNRERAPLLILLNPTGRGMKKKNNYFQHPPGQTVSAHHIPQHVTGALKHVAFGSRGLPL